MKHNLYQKDILLNKRWFEITQEGLSIKSKSIRESNELSLRFEDIGLKVVKSKNGKTGWLIATLISLGLSAIILIDRKTGGDTDKGDFLFYFLLSLVFFVIFVLTYKRSFYLTNNENKNAIEFLIDKPSRHALNEFIDTLKSEQKRYLVEKYGQLTNLLSYEQQYNQLLWLNNIGVLTKSEYEIKLIELNSIFKSSNPIIGFQVKKD